MIGSILRALAGHDRITPGAPIDGVPQAGLTRLHFLKLAATGTVAAGFATTACAGASARPGRVAPVTNIDDLYDAWQNRMNTADLEGLVDLYVEDVTYINPEGVLLHGKDAVRKDFEGILALKPQIVLGDRKHILWQDVALTTNHWRMTYPGADGTTQVATGGGIEVMRKQADGGWRYIIDDASRSASK